MSEAPSLGVYVHWPYCARICPYCDFNVVRARGRTEEEAALVEAMAADMAAQAQRMGPRTLVSIFFGGGTPSLMRPEWVARLIETARRLWPGEGPVEVSLEANPTDAEAARFAAFRDAGVERLSLGVQALDDTSLTFLGRQHDAAETRRAIATAAATFPRLSLDLIYALPGQTEARWIATLLEAEGSGAEHLSPYQLTIEDRTAFGRAHRRGVLKPQPEESAAALYDITQATLEGFGYEAYEVSNHARGEAARARHNLVYWRGEDYVGVGPGAHGRLTGPDGVRYATEAEPNIRRYVDRVSDAGCGFDSAPMSSRDRAEERVLMGLRTLEGVSLGELAALPLQRLPELVESGHIRRQGDRICATPAGRLLLDHVTERLIVG